MAESFTQISDPSVEVNNIVILVVPNSVSYKSGKGDSTVKVQSAGNGVVVPVPSKNVETNKGYFKLSMLETTQAIQLIEQWQNNSGGNVIAIGSVNKTMSRATVLGDPTHNLTDDGVVEVEFEGSQFIGG